MVDTSRSEMGSDTTIAPPDEAGDAVNARESGDWSAGALKVSHTVSDIAVVEELRAAGHDEYDRLVIEFQGTEIPGHTIRYLDAQAIECGSGRPVELAGTEVLELHLEPARGYTEAGEGTFDHSKRTVDGDVLLELDVSCDFEAVLAVAMGIDGRRPYRVMELENPARLVVDIRHSAN